MAKHSGPGRSCSTSLDTAVYRCIPGDDEFEIEVEVSGNVNPYWAGNYDNPPEGGDVDGIEARFYDAAAKKHRIIPLTKEEIQEFTQQLSERAAEAESDYHEEEYSEY